MMHPVLKLSLDGFALSAFCLVARTLDFQTPLRQRGVMIGFQLFDREGCRLECRWCERFEKRLSSRKTDWSVVA
jgi:hypothetical protein